VKDLNRRFIKEDVRMANNMKRCSKSLVREMQTKATVDYYIPDVGEGIEKLEPSHIIDGNVNGVG